MANWQNRLELKDLWEKHEKKEISIQKISKEVVKRLEKLQKKLEKSKEFEEYSYELNDIIAAFEFCEEDVEEFDQCLDDLYNWADTLLPTKKGMMQRKLCWVATF